MNLQDLKNTESFRVKFTTIEGNLHEGPMGLLWHLIESYEVDIFQVSLSRITEDFISYLKSGIVKLEEEADFVLMASRLLFYKSRLLLPNPNFEDDQEPDMLPIELVDQLLEYKKFQMAADSLKEIEERTQMTMVREQSWQEFEENLDAFEVDIISFLKIFKEFLTKSEKNIPYQIQEEEVSMDLVLEDMIQKLEIHKKIYFFEYIKNFSRNKMIVCFLAVLELLKLRVIKTMQFHQFGDIELIYLEKILGGGQN